MNSFDYMDDTHRIVRSIQEGREASRPVLTHEQRARVNETPIHGLQKLTLLDYPEHMACTVFLAGCNLNCPFCHNAELFGSSCVPPIMTFGELMDFLGKRHGLLSGVCITGGEPTQNRYLKDMLAEIKRIGFKTKLDTNGTDPDTLNEVIVRGLVDYVAMDVKNSPSKYGVTTGIVDKKTIAKHIRNIDESIYILTHDIIDYEFRTTVMKEYHTLDDMEQIGRWIHPGVRKARKYFIQPFVDRDTVRPNDLHAPSGEDLQKFKEIMQSYAQIVEIRG